MKASYFRKLYKARPFKPFTIETDSGESYPVPHPENVWISTPKGDVVIVTTSGDDDEFAMLDMSKITAAHVNKPKAKSRGKEAD